MSRKAFSGIPLLFLSSLVLPSGCTPPPEPLEIGSDQCSHCRMQISDDRFGGQVITEKGRVQKFDSIHCLIGYLKNSPAPREVLLSDYLQPGTFVAAEKAHFLRTDGVKDPMGPGLAVSSNKEGLEEIRKSKGGQWQSWSAVSSSAPSH